MTGSTVIIHLPVSHEKVLAGEGKPPISNDLAAGEPPKRHNPAVRGAIAAWDLACEHWFILGVGFAIGMAAAVPNLGKNGGYIRAEYTIKWGAVIVIFLLSGLTLKTRVLMDAAARLRLHGLIQFISLVLTPAIGFGVASLLKFSSMNRDLVSGLIVCTTMPTTVSTNVVFTKQAGGNEAAALVNAVIGNIVGIFVSPGWLYLYLGTGSQAPYGDVIKVMAYTVIAPLIVGQLVQYFVPNAQKHISWLQKQINFSKVSNVMILLLVFATFANTFSKKISVGAGSIVGIVFIELGLYILFTAICLSCGLWTPTQYLFNLNRPDTIALCNCGATKTLALGIPIITALFGKSPNAGILALPLIMYHAEQVLLGSILIGPLRKWKVRGDEADMRAAAASIEGGGGPAGPDAGSGALASTAAAVAGGLQGVGLGGKPGDLLDTPKGLGDGSSQGSGELPPKGVHDVRFAESGVIRSSAGSESQGGGPATAAAPAGEAGGRGHGRE